MREPLPKLADVRKVLAEGQPFWKQRNLFRALAEAPLPMPDAEAALSLLLDGVGTYRARPERLAAVRAITRVVMQAGVAPDSRISDVFDAFDDEQREHVVASMNEAAIAAVTEAVTKDGGSRWLSALVPAYVRGAPAAVKRASRVLDLATDENRASACLALRGTVDAGELVALALTRPDAHLLGPLFTADVEATLAALKDKPLDLLFRVARAVGTYEAAFVGIALLAAKVKPSKAEQATRDGLLFAALDNTGLLVDHASGKALRKALASACKKGFSLAWEEHSYGDFELEMIDDNLAEDPEAARSALLALVAEGRSLRNLPDARSKFSLLAGTNLHDLNDDMATDPEDAYWYLAPTGPLKLGKPMPRAARSALGDITELARLGRHHLVARMSGKTVVFGSVVEAAVESETPWDQLPLEPLEAEDTKLELAGERSRPAPSDGASMTQLADDVRAGRRVSIDEVDRRLTRWIASAEMTDWLVAPRILTAMGFPASVLEVTQRPVAAGDIEELDPGVREPQLEAMWRTVGALTFKVGSFELQFLTPKELGASSPELKGAPEGTFRVVATQGGKPAICIAVDDGSMSDDMEEHRYGWVDKGRWEGTGLGPLGYAMRMLDKRLIAALTAFAGRKVMEDLEVGAKVKAQPPPKKVARQKTVKDAWLAFAKWRKNNDVDVEFKKGANAKLLQKTTKSFPNLPAAFVESWTRHNGDDESGGFAGWSMMGLDHIDSEYAWWRKEHPSTWGEGLVPFASSGGGDFIAIDTSKKGKGRVVLASSDPWAHRVIAPSFEDWLFDFVGGLESATLQWDELGEFYADDN